MDGRVCRADPRDGRKRKRGNVAVSVDRMVLYLLGVPPFAISKSNCKLRQRRRRRQRLWMTKYIWVLVSHRASEAISNCYVWLSMHSVRSLFAIVTAVSGYSDLFIVWCSPLERMPCNRRVLASIRSLSLFLPLTPARSLSLSISLSSLL